MDIEKVIRIIDELIFEAQKEPIWKAENALRCLKKELLKEQEPIKPNKKEDVHRLFSLEKHGEWQTIWDRNDPDTSSEARCSVCGRVSERPLGHYCKWCGSTMDKE